MTLDPSLMAGLIGAGATLVIGATPFLIGWGALHSTVEALKLRVAALEAATDAITQIREDVAFIRGQLAGTEAQ
jgi:hypothetical protein